MKKDGYKCRKVRFASEKTCETRIKQLGQMGNPSADTMHPYECDKCNAWHITTVNDKRLVLLRAENDRLTKELAEALEKLSQLATSSGTSNKQLRQNLANETARMRARLAVVIKENGILQKQTIDQMKEINSLKNQINNQNE